MGNGNRDLIKDLRSRLASAPHGGVEYEALEALRPLAAAKDRDALVVIIEHARRPGGIHRDHAVHILAELAGATGPGASLAPTPDAAWASYFMPFLADTGTAYWAIPGLTRTGGRPAYSELVSLAADSARPVEHRAYAIKCLSQATGQLFDRDLPRDPGHWKPQDLRLDELLAWQAQNFPQGPGYPPPPRDPALDNPNTALEHLAARLDRLLLAQRHAMNAYRPDDPAVPSMRLVPARREDLTAVTSRWTLPPAYLDFLTRFSPLRVSINTEEFYNGGLALYGAADLIPRQAGYAWHPDPTHPLSTWPPNLLVIANHGGDPYVLDLARAPDRAPILTAEHGTGRWDFKEVAPSFERFLEQLLETMQ